MVGNCPLTKEHCEALTRVLQSVSLAEDLARKCQECGLDTSEFLNQLAAQKDMASKLKAKFFPDEP